MGQVKTFRNQLQSNCLWGRDRAPDRPTAGVTVPRTGVPRRPDCGLLSGRCPVLVSSVAKNMLLARTRPNPPVRPNQDQPNPQSAIRNGTDSRPRLQHGTNTEAEARTERSAPVG